jgi:hypothetical protein
MTTEQAFAEKMVEKYRDLLLSAAGLKSITIDGQAVSYADLEDLYDRWSKKLARLNSARPSVVGLDLRNA